jgi:hypothetical protein
MSDLDRSKPIGTQAHVFGGTALTPLFTAPTPFPGLPEVSLLRETWDRHIVKNHPYGR